jgi:hypothetical protein
MSKYYPLQRYFEKADRSRAIVLTFTQVEKILMNVLPPSAREHPAFWANNGERHVHAEAWLNARWSVETVDLTNEVVTFTPKKR